MKNQFKSKSFQIPLLLGMVQIFILFNIIFPHYENKPYFETRIQQLEEELQNKVEQQIFLNERKHLKTTLKASPSFEKFSEASLQTIVGSLLRANSIKVHTQQIQEFQRGKDLSSYTLSQTLEGRYDTTVKYITALLDSGLPIVLSEITVQNLELKERSPSLRTQLRFSYFLPEN